MFVSIKTFPINKGNKDKDKNKETETTNKK